MYILFISDTIHCEKEKLIVGFTKISNNYFLFDFLQNLST